MSYRCDNPEKYEGKVVDNGHCVRFVQVATNVGHTTGWTQGEHVQKSAYIAKGTVIATFVNGHYPTDDKGKHAAIYISHDQYGIQVWDQYLGKPVGKRTIAYKDGDPYRSNDGDTFYVVE
jgi:hypothetical protein